MKPGALASFGAHLKHLREAAGFTQEELATIAGLSVHAVSALERGHRRRPHVETVRALSAALDLTGPVRDAFAASARAAVVPTAADELSDVALPLAPTVLYGRGGDVQALWQWLAEPDVRLITIIGPGGVGKTRLALELARRIADEGSTRVVFVPLAYIRDPALVAPAIAEALGLADLSGSDLPRRVHAACGGHATLLVLDNFEQLPDAAPLAVDLLAVIPVLRLVITSRAPLHVRGEREYVLGPLTLEQSTEAMAPVDLARVPAVRLFVERVRDVQPDFRLTAANARTITAICRRLDALPLALELAAPWMKVLTAEDLLGRLERNPLLSTAGPRDLPERQQTMNATVAWSYELLDPSMQRALRRLGALSGRFSIDAAEAVLCDHDDTSTPGDAVCALAALIDKSLLLRAETAVATRPLFRMLETVRAFAARELAAADDPDAAMEGPARYCVGEASRVFTGLVGPAQADWLHRVHEDLDNYRSTLTWLLARDRTAEAADVAWGLLFFWVIRGQAAEGLHWYRAILKTSSLPPAVEARALTGAAYMWFSQGELATARAALNRVFALPRPAGGRDAAVWAEAEDVSARIELGRGDFAAAHDWFLRAVASFTALGLPWGVGHALIGMSGAFIDTGGADRAEQLLDEATTVLHDGAPWFLARALLVRGILAVRRGAADEALVLARDSLTHIRDLHDKYAFVHAAVPLAAAAALKGDYAWSARIAGARTVVEERTGVRVVIRPAQALIEQIERAVRARLGAERWDLAYGAGRRVSIDGLLNDIEHVLSNDVAT